MSAKNYNNLFLGSIMMSLAVLITCQGAQARDAAKSTFEVEKPQYFYIGLDYSPAFSNIRNFTIQESNGETKAIYPYIRGDKEIILDASRFDWNMPNPRIGFKNSTLVAVGSSIGYAMGSMRLEIEVSHERFKSRGRYIGNEREEESDTIYLLAKELGHSTVTEKTEDLVSALTKVKGEDIVRLANALEKTRPDIGRKICRTRSITGGKNYGKYNRYTSWLKDTNNLTALCGDIGGNSDKHEHHNMIQNSFKDFAREALLGGSTNWPTTTGDKTRGNDNAKALARDLITVLSREEKIAVAGLMVNTIEGGEVVDIGEISSTSVMVNVCYDFLSKEGSIVPYGCMGLGSNFVGIVKGHFTPKPAYRLKAGVSYKLFSGVDIFAAGFYHRVFGSTEYTDIPVEYLIDDVSPYGRTKETAMADFRMSYAGGEFGMRFAF
ncbi:P44/Msp2 family outer membrane protein [Anaplasma phagocytophilum]|uniref:p44-72 outer membrane protein n=3 Tax=Anaplasma phagocytophilum TaxID=948 RepID=Q2GK55_ANAPZ|nr:P44/Msp2 family outer membrane protein [Anaplasma phagocytophilum]KJZ98541.1 surface antigen family protein [Anaplasma phagocytophilum str. CR1007]ABD43785.1 P44-72 outer membrane protein [Anaplasma phagocytophilum str. HZ]AGR79421.1 p44 outer membrane protein [Anaplasma phagocytophilum str. HZ2]AGR80668.1 p44 outer membrane protein [Anaplasma phagocytophilum str. JM]AGR81924.1 p44 outer membrane protein [Anaplasma phagocytophilum str. Dog2]